jgi:hypothetical protein
MLDLNLSISEILLASTDLFITIKPKEDGGSEGRSTKSSILTLSAQTRIWKCHAERLLRRLDGSSVLVSFCICRSIRLHNDSLGDLGKQHSRRQSARDSTSQQRHDSRARGSGSRGRAEGEAGCQNVKHNNYTGLCVFACEFCGCTFPPCLSSKLFCVSS